MWFLEHESLFGGKRVWLRPGSQQLFGRTKSDDEDGPQGTKWKIDNKAVSRKHVMLKVYDAASEDGTKLHKRSQIEVTDLSCRQGITIDDKTTLKSQKAADGSTEYSHEILKGTEHTIRLAASYAPFKIVWRPIVFTYASKESKESKAKSAQLHTLDIKTTADFVFDKTTHVVSAKRNLPKVLSGLTAAKHIVTTEFLDAVLRVTAPSVDEDSNYLPSKLEQDFDTWWPAEKEYTPAVGAEPVLRPQEMLLPDSSRAEVFSGLTFVFLNEGQYSSLLDPVTGGGGKALLYDVRLGETTIEEYVDYVYSVAGKKRRGKPGDKLPVITVRLPTYPHEMEEWATNLVTGVDQALGQRSVLQNEFLDVIITKDRATIQRPPAEVNTPASTPAPEVMTIRRSMRQSTPMSQSRAPPQAPQESAPLAEEAAKTIPRKRVHRPKTSRFTGFDDDEPIPKKKLKVENAHLEDVQQSESPAGPSKAASQTRTAAGTQHQTPPQPHVQNTIEKEEQMNTLFPTAAKMRKQRAATRAPSASVEPEGEGTVKKPAKRGAETLAQLNRAEKKAEKDINIREHTRQRIKEEEERRKADEESLREALEGIDITELKNLAKIEEMHVLPRQNRSTARNQSQTNNERWNAEWNGRKNFKKFRRRGAEQGVQAPKVLVTLEEAPSKNTHGITDAFFLDDPEPSSRSRDSRRGRTAAVDSDSSEPEVGGFTRRQRTTQSQPQQEVINVEDSGPDDEEVPEQRTQRSSGRTQRVVETQLESTQTQRGKKRGSGAASSGQPAGKKGRFGRRDDDSDDEETGFRFKRRT